MSEAAVFSERDQHHMNVIESAVLRLSNQKKNPVTKTEIYDYLPRSCMTRERLKDVLDRLVEAKRLTLTIIRNKNRYYATGDPSFTQRGVSEFDCCIYDMRTNRIVFGKFSVNTEYPLQDRTYGDGFRILKDYHDKDVPVFINRLMGQGGNSQ